MSVRYSPEQLAALAKKSKGSLPADSPRPCGSIFQTMRPLLYIGIDPGQNTGFAIWQPRSGTFTGKYVEVVTYSFVQAVRRLESMAREFGASKIRVRIEDVRGKVNIFRQRQGEG